jgi:heptosyltransferase-2
VKILVIRLSSLGDVVLTLPVFSALRQAFPDAHLTALTKEAYADALRASPDINECLTLGKDESLASLTGRIRAQGFDAILDLHGNLRSRVISFLSRAPRVVRYSKAAFARRLFVGLRVSSAELERHTLDRYLDAVREFTGIEPKKDLSILVIQTAFLGDAVLTTPLLGALRDRFPLAHINVLATPEVADVFRQHPAVAETLIFDKRGREKTLCARWRLAQSLRHSRYDLAVIPHRSLTSALLAWLAGIPRRVGFDTSQGRWLLTDRVPFRWGTHDVERNLALMQPFGAASSGIEWDLRPDPIAQKTIEERLRAAGVQPDERLIGINAGSVWATKRWLPEGFAAVADRLSQELKVRVLFIGGAKDRPVVDSVIKQMRHPPLNWAGETSLKELIAAIARCVVFLTNDSGPMHIAVASGVPTVALFGPTTKELGFFPYGSGHTVIEKNLDCRPCGLHGAEKCPLGHFQCMRQITPDEVFKAVKAHFEAVVRA